MAFNRGGLIRGRVAAENSGNIFGAKINFLSINVSFLLSVFSFLKCFFF